MRLSFKFILVVLAFLFTIPVISNAATYYVNDDTGSDSWPGDSEESPFATIQAAVNATSATGDEIRVAEGTYTGVTSVIEQYTAGETETYYQVVFIGNKSLTLRGGYDIRDWNTSNPELNVTTIDAGESGRGCHIASCKDILSASSGHL